MFLPGYCSGTLAVWATFVALTDQMNCLLQREEAVAFVGNRKRGIGWNITSGTSAPHAAEAEIARTARVPAKAASVQNAPALESAQTAKGQAANQISDQAASLAAQHLVPSP